MITRFKIFENKNSEPQNGDYVILSLNFYPYINGDLLDDDIENIENNIGYIEYIDANDGYTKYNISIDSKNDRIRNMDLWVDRDEIIHFSKSKKELEIIKDADNYNL